MRRRYLMTPGPSQVPSFVREALSQEIMHHRTEEFRAILGEVFQGLKDVFCTKNPVLVLAASGTGAMEAAVSNVFAAEDSVLAINGGKFGERWSEIAKGYGLEVAEMVLEWGSAPEPKAVAKMLDQNKGIRGILTTLCETSTATVYDIQALGRLAKERGLLLVVDAISGLGQDRLFSDAWGVDVVVSGSQKGLMLPPGLAFISMSKDAQEAAKRSDLPKYYFDLLKALKSQEKSDTPYTPAVSLLVGLHAVLAHIRDEGLERRWRRFEKMAQAAQEAAKVLGLKLFSRKPSASVTAICSPQGVKSSDLVKKMRKNFGVSIAGGQAEAKDKIFRIAHMGWVNEQDLLMCFSLLEKTLKELGYQCRTGASCARLQEVFYG